MHLRNVKVFCDVARRRSFSKAGELNGVSQSSVSQTVHQLEERLGTQLVDRSKRPLELTPAGAVYFEGCRKLLNGFREMEDSVQQLGNRVAGRLRIASIYSVGLLQMHEYVQRYQELYPLVELSIEYLHPDEVYQRVVSDDADLGLVSFPRDGGELTSIPWQKQPMALVVSPGHPLSRRRSVSVQELSGERFIGFASDLTIRKQIARWLRRAKVTVRVVHEFDNVEYIKRAVEIGAGVTVLPTPTLRRELEDGTLVAIPFHDVAWYRPLGLIHKRHKALTTPVRKFVELLELSSDGNASRSLESQEKSSDGNGRESQTTLAHTHG